MTEDEIVDFGDPNYLDNSVWMNAQLSKKSDVFAFSMMALEVSSAVIKYLLEVKFLCGEWMHDVSHGTLVFSLSSTYC